METVGGMISPPWALLLVYFNALSKRSHSFPTLFPTCLGSITIFTPRRAAHIAKHLGTGRASVYRALEPADTRL
jgi:hypothetical protein